MARMKRLERGDPRLTKTYTEEHLKAEIVQEAQAKKFVVWPSCQREMARAALEHRKSHSKVTCHAVRISEAFYRYLPKRSIESAPIADRLVGLTQRYWT